VTLIGVKSKYGSGWGTSPGIININDTPPKKKGLCKEHKVYLVLWFESIGRPPNGCITVYTSFFYKKIVYWYRLVNLFSGKKVRVLELVDRTNLSFVDNMS
jgi:hypothetical protein